MVVGSKYLIRDINTANVLETIIKDAPVSRLDIAKKTGLTKGTISTIVQNLLDNSLVCETAPVGNGIGRKTFMLELLPSAGYCITIDVEAATLRFMTSDLCGQKIRLHTSNISISQDISMEIISQLEKCEELAPKTPFGLVGISIATHANVMALQLENLKEKLALRFFVPTFIANHGYFSALGENSYSMNAESMVFIDNTNDISMGVINNGKPFVGENKNACQLGRMLIDVGKCEKPAFLEDKTSLSVLLNKLSEDKGLTINCEDFLTLFKNNDNSAQKIADIFIDYMRIALLNVISFYGTEVIVINSPFVANSDEIFLRLKNSLGADKRVLYRSMLKDDAVLYGGAACCITNFLKLDNFKPSRCYFKKMHFI